MEETNAKRMRIYELFQLSSYTPLLLCVMKRKPNLFDSFFFKIIFVTSLKKINKKRRKEEF